MDLFAFLYGQISKTSSIVQPASAAPHKSLLTISITLDLEPCCLESFLFAIQVSSQAGILDRSQQDCLASLVGQIVDHVPAARRATLTDAVKYAVERHADRQQRKLFNVATAAPSLN